MKYIGSIGNHYGGLSVRTDNDKYYWGIEDWNGTTDWEEIPHSLYMELIKFENEDE